MKNKENNTPNSKDIDAERENIKKTLRSFSRLSTSSNKNAVITFTEGNKIYTQKGNEEKIQKGIVSKKVKISQKIIKL